MLFVVRLGPVIVAEDETFVYLAFADDGEAVGQTVGKDDALALRELKGRGTAPFRCEARMGAAAAAEGFEIAPPPDTAARAKAVMGVVLATEKKSWPMTPPLIEAVAQAGARLAQAAPWTTIDSDQPLWVEVRGSAATFAEASVLGSGGVEHGVALYKGPGTVRAMHERGSDPATFARVDSLALTLDAEPAFAAEAVAGAFGTAVVPVPLRVKRGRLSRPEESELTVLALAAEAAVGLADGRTESTAEASVGGRMVSVTLSLTPRAKTPAAPVQLASFERPMTPKKKGKRR